MLSTLLLGQELREIGEDNGDGPSNPEGIARIQHWRTATFLISCPSALDPRGPFIVQTFLKRLLLTPSALQAPSPPATKHSSSGPWEQGSGSQGKGRDKH